MVTQNPLPPGPGVHSAPPGPGPSSRFPPSSCPHTQLRLPGVHSPRWTHTPTLVAEAAAIYFNKVQLCPAASATQPAFGSRRTRPCSREMVTFLKVTLKQRRMKKARMAVSPSRSRGAPAPHQARGQGTWATQSRDGDNGQNRGGGGGRSCSPASGIGSRSRPGSPDGRLAGVGQGCPLRSWRGGAPGVRGEEGSCASRGGQGTPGTREMSLTSS